MFMTLLAVLLGLAGCLAQDDWTLEPLPYRHPGLVVDLGVGLWAWPIPCDADGDGDFDLIISCPDKPSNGIWYFQNPGPHSHQNNDKHWPIFEPAIRLSPTVHYVMPSYVNGQLRVVSPGLEYEQFSQLGTSQPRPMPVDFKFYKPIGKQPKGPKVRHQQWRYVDWDGDGKTDLLAGMEDWSEYGWDDAWNDRGEWINGPLHGFVFWFRNTTSDDAPSYAQPIRLEAHGQAIDTFGCPSPSAEDFDGDGDLDLLCGEFLDGFTYFENLGTRTSPQLAEGRPLRLANGQRLTMELQMIVPVAFDWDQDRDMDLIVGDEDGRVAWIEHTGEYSPDGTPCFAAPRYFQQRADTLKCGALATPVGVDWDEDGDTDIISGNTAGYLEWFENRSGPNVAEPMWNAPKKLEIHGVPFRIQAGTNGSIQGPAEAKWGYTCLSVADWDGDGLKDIVFNSILGEVMFLRNSGQPGSLQLEPPQPIEVEWVNQQPSLAWGWRKPKGKALLTQWRTTPLVYDFNQDGLLDLAMLDHEGYLSYFQRDQTPAGRLILLPPRRLFLDEAGNPLRLSTRSAGGSGRRKLCVVDWDRDGKFDFLLNSTNADFLQQVESPEEGWRFRSAGSLSSRNIEGHDVSPTVVDFDGDGVMEFLGGAEDGRLYLRRKVAPKN